MNVSDYRKNSRGLPRARRRAKPESNLSSDLYNSVLFEGRLRRIEKEGIARRVFSGTQKSQGYKTRAPEGMSILAFLGISPFQRLLIPLTPIIISGDNKWSSILCDINPDIINGEIPPVPCQRDPTFSPDRSRRALCDKKLQYLSASPIPLRQPIPALPLLIHIKARSIYAGARRFYAFCN